MRDSIKISVPQPCAERWDNFTVTPHGGFCGSCSKTVIDFTLMSDADILKHFAGESRQGHTCGRFRADQLKAYQLQALPKFRPGLTLLRAGFIGIMVVLAGQHAGAQQVGGKHPSPTEQTDRNVMGKVSAASEGITLKGVVKEGESGELMPGVNVLLKGSTTGTQTDATGRFEFPGRLHEDDVLVFSFIGFETKEYLVANEGKNLDIEIKFAPDLIVLGAVAVEEPYKTPRGFSAVWNKVKSIF